MSSELLFYTLVFSVPVIVIVGAVYAACGLNREQEEDRLEDIRLQQEEKTALPDAVFVPFVQSVEKTDTIETTITTTEVAAAEEKPKAPKKKTTARKPRKKKE